MRRRIRELRLQGVATWLNYLSEDVDEKRDMEAPPEIRLESFGTTREPITGNITQLLASHPRETERMRRALSPRGAITWMAFGGNTRDLGSFGEETDKITDLHQILEEVLFTKRGDGVAGIKRRRRDPSNDGVKDLTTASECSHLKYLRRF
ncbi:hypothetical protein Tco_1012727 [Tanacetum coccineum]